MKIVLSPGQRATCRSAIGRATKIVVAAGKAYDRAELSSLAADALEGELHGTLTKLDLGLYGSDDDELEFNDIDRRVLRFSLRVFRSQVEGVQENEQQLEIMTTESEKRLAAIDKLARAFAEQIELPSLLPPGTTVEIVPVEVAMRGP